MASAFKIIKNAPPIEESRGAPSRYPWDALDVGDAFDVPCVRPIDDKGRYPDHGAVAATCSNRNTRGAGLVDGKEFKCRLIDGENGGKVARVWRLK